MVPYRTFTVSQLSLVMRKNKYTKGKPVLCHMTDGLIESLQRQNCLLLSRQWKIAHIVLIIFKGILSSFLNAYLHYQGPSG